MQFILANLDWLAGGLELIASWIIGNKNKWGHVLNVLGLLTWIYVAFNRDVHGLLLVVVPAIFISARNFRKWTKGKPRTLLWEVYNYSVIAS